MCGMSTAALPHGLPPPQIIRDHIDALEDELKALRRLLRASSAAHKADEARRRRQAADVNTARGGPHDAA
jgi:hypothetical protein